MFMQPIDRKEEQDAIIVENVSKHFKIPHEKRRTLLDNLVGLLEGKKQSYEEFYALKNINFSVKKGETLGIIGENGSGKSTLLKIIAGVLQPDAGSIKVNGKIAPFLELGVGFQPELSAEENVRLYGAVMGMGRRKIEEKFEEIFEFAELERFKEMKLKNFSSGMYMRLAFATATATEPDVLLIDEVLAVGDEAFQRKCFKRIEEFKDSNKTIIYISHDSTSVKKLCKDVILLKYGEIIENSSADLVINKYHAMLSDKVIINEQKPVVNQPIYKRYGTKKAEIFGVLLKIKDSKNESKNIKIIKFGEDTSIELKIRFHEDVVDPIAGYIIRDEGGRVVYNTNTHWNNIILGRFKKNETIYITFSQRMFLNSGLFFITAALAYTDEAQFYDWLDNAIQFRVINNQKSSGVVDLKSEIKIIRC